MKTKNIGLAIAVSIFALLPFAGYYFVLHYLLMPPITNASRFLSMSVAFGSSPFCVIAASYVTLVWERTDGK